MLNAKTMAGIKRYQGISRDGTGVLSTAPIRKIAKVMSTRVTWILEKMKTMEYPSTLLRQGQMEYQIERCWEYMKVQSLVRLCALAVH